MSEDVVVLLTCEAVLFDCDGVLVDSDAAVLDAWTRWAHDLRLDPAAVTATVHGRRSADTVAAFVSPDAIADAVTLIDRLEVDNAGQVTAIAGATTLLAAIPQGRWAVVTSGRRELARARLQAAGLPVPDVLVTADDVTHGKPDPEGYALAARRLGVAPDAAAVVEDAAAGIRAGRDAGVAHVLGVGSRSSEGDPDAIVADLRDVAWTPSGLLVRG